MVDPRRHAAALLAVLLLALPAAPAFAQDASPTPEPLSGNLPGGGSEGDEGETEGNETETESPDTESTEPLAETGLDAGLVALLGLGLLASGGGLRASLRAHEQR